MKKRFLVSLLTATMCVSALAGCGDKKDNSAPANSGAQSAQTQKTENTQEVKNENVQTPESSGEEVTIKLFSNLPDRKNG